MGESVEGKILANYDTVDAVPLFAGVRSRDLSEGERRQVASALPKLFAFIAASFAAAVAALWWLGPAAVPAAVASTTIAVGAYVDGLIAAGIVTKVGGGVLMTIATWGIFRRAGKKRGHSDFM